ncbi:venom protein 164-like [Tubulanus polymorphus]|uniref:venom protein 164-like n=1 Tax=Tubulanus polymorphus TaxID=672921 RepID=UPI003DA5C1D0
MNVLLLITSTTLLFAYSQAKYTCFSQEDCPRGTCCTLDPRVGKAACLPMRKIDDPCAQDNELIDGKFYHICPCAKGLRCKTEAMKFGKQDFSFETCKPYKKYYGYY